MSGVPGFTAFIGAIGEDAFGEQLEKAAKADGVDRALIANLAAANVYEKAHFDSAPIQALLKATKIVYCAGFPFTTAAGPPTIMAIGKELNAEGKTFCMNLSA